MNIELLKRLCEVPGIPGREERVRAIIEEEVADLFDDIETDAMGSLICRRAPRSAGKGKKTTKKKASGKAATKVMLACHMDEIGFYVKHIDKDGFLKLSPAGGFDVRNLFSRRVLVVTETGDYVGVMNPGGKPVHISSPEERTKIPEVGEFFVDLGMTAAQVKKTVRIGDYVVMHEPAIEMGDAFVSKAIDNRFACWLGIEGVRALEKSGRGHACEIVVAFTVQEEVGIRGAKTAAYAVQPDIGIGIDVTLACDTPGVHEDWHLTTQGEGVSIQILDGSVINSKELVDEFEAVAKKNRIKHQRALLTGGGTDTAAMQMAAAGCKTACISVGTRYIHTVTEMVSKSDLDASVKLLSAYLAQVK